MGAHASDLPAAVRKKYGLDKAPGQRTKPSTAGTSDRVPCPGHCVCGEAFATAHDWQTHADEHGHTRWDIDLEALA